MQILLTNDDGWDAPGLAVLREVAASFGSVTTVAPARPQSGISHQLTLHRPMNWEQRGPDLYSLDGTPADCVRIALTQLSDEFDWVLSGVNDGANLGADIYVSGTVAGAREARLFGFPAMAISQYRLRYHEAFDWSGVCRRLDGVLQRFLGPQPTESQLININFPDPESVTQELSIVECPVDPHPLPSQYLSTDEGYRYNSRYRDRNREPGCDVQVCFDGGISVTYL